MDVAKRKALIQVALGQREANIYIKNGRLVNVYSGEVLEGQGVALWEDRIAYVGPSEAMVGEGTQVLDAQGLYLLPGFIDPHAHADFFYNPHALCQAVLPLGTTAMLSDTHDIGGALGEEGLRWMLQATQGLPLKFYFCAPAVVPPFPALEGEDAFPLQRLESYLQHERVVSTSEITPWVRVLAQDETLLEKMALAQKHRRRVEGHTTGASPEKLNALVAAGITSCHEALTVEETRHRLRLGLYVMLRQGSIRSDLEALGTIVTEHPERDMGRISLTPDWMSPLDICRYGYMDYLVGKAIEVGIPPLKAIQMATINPATYLRLESEIGGIAPGRIADILFVEDLAQPKPQQVICNGFLTARDRQLLLDLPQLPPSPATSSWRPGRLPALPLSVEAFRVRAPASLEGGIRVPLISIHDSTITRLMEASLPVRDGYIELDPQGVPQVIKIGVWGKDGAGFALGFLSGLGFRVGGLASSVADQAHNPMVLGSREEDMLLALERMLQLGGGMVHVEGGKVVAELPLPIGGMQSLASVPELAREMETFNASLRKRGCPLEDPILTIVFLTFAGLPFARMTPSGVLDVRAGRIVFPPGG